VLPTHFQRGRLAQGILTGALAAAATAGTLLGFGLRQGTPARPFNTVASLLLGDRAQGIWGFHPVVTAVGVIVLLTLTLGWGVLFARLAGGMRGWRLAGAAMVVAGAALALDVFVATRLRSGNLSEALAPAQVIAVHIVLGVALGVGMRLATSYLWSD
jgi:hypothetical protein